MSNQNTPPVVFSTGYGSRLDGLRTSFSAAIDGTADFINGYIYDAMLRLTDVTQHGVGGGNAVAPKHVHLEYTDAGQLEYVRRYESLDDSNVVAQSHYTYACLLYTSDAADE